VPPNPPRPDAASPARGGGESQRHCFCSARVSRWAAGEMPKDVGPKARLPAPAAGSLPRLGVCPTVRVSAESQRAFRLLAARSRQPRCEGVWPRLRAGLCCKSARACREIRHGSAQQVPSGEAKKVSHGVPAHRAWTVASGWSNNGLVSAVGRGILLSSSAKKVHHCPAFLPSCLIHNPVFSSSAGSSPMQWANICAQGTG